MRVIGNVLWLALCLGSGSFGAAAIAGTGIDSDLAPPPARDERPPAPRDGYVWAPGYWDWDGRAYSWVPGRFMFERRGVHWVADRWEQTGPHWQRLAGHWEH
jgi:hypothetical protein